MNQFQLSKDYDHLFNDSKFMVNAYKDLESTGALKRYVQENGYTYIMENFKVDIVGEKWRELINRF